jgi:hypothetical protein
MSPSKRDATQPAQARPRRRLQAHERLERERRQAPRAVEARHQARQDLGLPAHLGGAIAGRVHSQPTLLGQNVGMMLPALCGGRTPSAFCRGRGGDTPWPSRSLGAWPTRSWRKRRRRFGRDGFAPLWRPVAPKSPATPSRWPWTWGWEDSVCHQDGEPVGVVGRWWSGQQQRVWSGLDGRVLLGSWALAAGSSPWPVPCAGLRRWGLGRPGGTNAAGRR